MPRLKKEADKKTAAKKPHIKRVQKKEKPSAKTAQPITIDVIADDEDILVRHPAAELPAADIEERENFDVQKKYFSDLVAEMKDKKISEDSEANREKPVKKRKSLNLYRRIALQFFGLTIIFLAAVAYFFLPSLSISLHPSAEAVSDSMSFNIAASVDEQAPAVANSRVLAGHIQTIPLSAEKIYEASGEEILGEEVAGEVTLHNEYTKDQALVATTRLLSADNKLFRLKEAVNIPAGSTVKAQVYADKASSDMAIAPTRFSIPGLWLGLQDKIYATSENAFEYRHQIKKYIKQRDIDQAINDIKATLKIKADQSISSFYNNGEALAYTLDDGAAKISLGAKLGEEAAEFSVSASNDLAIASFSKDQAETLVKAKLAFLLPDDKKLSSFDSNDIVYRLDAFDKDKGTATVTASFKGLMSLRTDANIIDKRQLVNLNQAQISEYLKSFPEVESYELKFFPGFIKRAPSLADRIKISVD